MATNSIINPAPSVIIDSFNQDLWNDIDKTTSSTLPSNTVSLSFGDTNTMTGTNTYNTLANNAFVNYTYSPYFNDNWYLRYPFYYGPIGGNQQLFAVYNNIYVYNLSSTLTLTIPNADSNLNGFTITFRRYLSSSSNTYQILSASSNINNIDTLTNTNVILNTGIITSMITCAYNGSSYQWFMSFQY